MHVSLSTGTIRRTRSLVCLICQLETSLVLTVVSKYSIREELHLWSFDVCYSLRPNAGWFFFWDTFVASYTEKGIICFMWGEQYQYMYTFCVPLNFFLRGIAELPALYPDFCFYRFNDIYSITAAGIFLGLYLTSWFMGIFREPSVCYYIALSINLFDKYF